MPHHLIERVDPVRLLVRKGFVPNMRTDALVFATQKLAALLFNEMKNSSGGPMLPALRQVCPRAHLTCCGTNAP